MLASMLLRRKRRKEVDPSEDLSEDLSEERPAKRSRLLLEQPRAENDNESGSESDASFSPSTSSASSSEGESENESESDDGMGVAPRRRNTNRSDTLQLTLYDREQAAEAREEASGILVTGKRVRTPRQVGTEWFLDEELDADGEHVIPPHTVVPIVVDGGTGDDPDTAPLKGDPTRWIVQHITSMRRDDKTGEVSVRVKWFDLDACEASWEPFEYICRKAPIPMTRYCVNLIKKDPELNAERIESKLRAFCAAVVERAF